MNFYSKNTKKDIVMSEKDGENYKNNNNCYFCEQEILDNTKVKDHCNLTGKYKGPAHYLCNLYVNQKEVDKILKWQSKLTFAGIHKEYENYSTYTFKRNEIPVNKPIYLGFSVLELSKLHMYETYYEKLQPYFREKNIQCHYMDTVTKDTPNIIKENENIKILRFDEIIDEENWYQNENIITQWGEKEFGDCKNLKIWTSEGWKNIKKITRHQTEKDFYRIRTKHAIVDVTEDHSLLDQNREIIKPSDLILGEELLHNHMNFSESKITFDEIINKIYNIEPSTTKEKEMFVKGFFLGDGSSRV